MVDEVSDVKCEKCGRMMVYKYGKYGKFLACPGFPECRNIKPIVETIDVPCPKCGAKVQVRKTKKKKKIIIYVKIILNHVIIFHGINLRLVKSGIQKMQQM